MGGNPVSRIDPDGRFFVVLFGPSAATAIADLITIGALGQTASNALNNIYNANQGDTENSEPIARQKGDGMTSSDDPLQQLEEIEKAQKAVREGKSKKRIDCIGKSKQRAKIILKV